MQQVQNEGVNFYLGFTDLQIMALKFIKPLIDLSVRGFARR